MQKSTISTLKDLIITMPQINYKLQKQKSNASLSLDTNYDSSRSVTINFQNFKKKTKNVYNSFSNLQDITDAQLQIKKQCLEERLIFTNRSQNQFLKNTNNYSKINGISECTHNTLKSNSNNSFIFNKADKA